MVRNAVVVAFGRLVEVGMFCIGVLREPASVCAGNVEDVRKDAGQLQKAQRAVEVVLDKCV